MLYFVVFAFVYRLAMLAVSVRHEKALRREGAVEYGAANSTALALAHVAFYLGATYEGFHRAQGFDVISILGLCLYCFGAVMLFTVVRLLGPMWTVKLMIAPRQTLVTHPLFRYVRHPNYYLNIIPELVGFALYLHAYVTLCVGLVPYLVLLLTRIRLEERVMRETFSFY